MAAKSGVFELLCLVLVATFGIWPSQQQLLDSFPKSVIHYAIRPEQPTANNASVCQYRCGPYPVAMDLITSTRLWFWNDSTPLGFQIVSGSFDIEAAFCPLSRLSNDTTNVTFGLRFNSRAMKNVSLADGWCEGRAIINLTNYLITRNGGNSFPWDIFVRTLNTLRFELYTPQSYALIASVSLSVTVQDMRPNYALTKPGYPYVCGEDLTLRIMATHVAPLLFYECSLFGSITTSARHISNNETAILYECVFDGEILDIYSFCAAVGSWTSIPFYFYPSPEFNVQFPSTYVDFYFNPTDLGLTPALIPENRSILMYLTSNSTFIEMDHITVFWNGTKIPSKFINESHILIKVPQSDNGTFGCLSVAMNGIDQVPTDCSLQLRYGPADGHYILPPQWPDPFVPPSPNHVPQAPLQPSTYQSFEYFSRKHWYIYMIVGAMAITLAVTLACVRHRNRKLHGGSGHEYRPLGSLSVDLDPKVYVSSSDIKLINLVGHGSFASVHKGMWRGTPVAVKRLHPHMRDTSMSDFVREAALMLNLRHPNVVALMGISRDEDTFSIITEFLERGSLDDILHNASIIIEPEHVRLFALDAAKGMTYLHAAGVLHRDLKCGNLLVDKDWNVKVADFGLSRDNDSNDATMTACGTPSWAAPEVIRHQKYSFKADVFSFAICLWEMCTRSKPYEDIPPYQVVIAVAMKGLRPTLSPKIHRSFMRLMVQCWDDRPEVRPAFLEITGILEDMQCPHPMHDFPFDPNDTNTRTRIRRSTNSISTTSNGQQGTGMGSMDNQGTAPAMPGIPSPSPPSSVSNSISHSHSGSQSRSPSSGGESPAETAKSRAIRSEKRPLGSSQKSKRKKLGKFAAYAVSAPSSQSPQVPVARPESEARLTSPPNSLPTISETQELPDSAQNHTSMNGGNDRNSSRASQNDFMISL